MTTDDIRLVASDLDGTLFDATRRVAAVTAATLQRVASAGVTVVAATGRSHWTAIPRLEPVGAFRWAICSNGSTLYDFETRTVVERFPLDATARAAIADLPSRLPGVGLAWEHDAGIHRDSAYRAHHARRGGPRFEEPSVVFDPRLELNKVMIAHDDLVLDALLDAVLPLLPPDLEVSSSGAAFVEVTAPGVDKGAALARLATRTGLGPNQVVAFGDQHNDVGMLAWAGRGYAMANAHPSVLAVTPLRAPHHDEHGVAQILDRLVR